MPSIASAADPMRSTRPTSAGLRGIPLLGKSSCQISKTTLRTTEPCPQPPRFWHASLDMSALSAGSFSCQADGRFLHVVAPCDSRATQPEPIGEAPTDDDQKSRPPARRTCLSSAFKLADTRPHLVTGDPAHVVG